MYQTITIPLGRNAALGNLAVDTDKFAAPIHRHIYEYGLRQLINDAMAQKKDDDGNDLSADAIRAKAEKRLANLYAGEIRATRAAAEPADPIEAEAHKLAWEFLSDAFKVPAKEAPKGTKNRVLWAINDSRHAGGKPELTQAEACAAFLAGPKGAETRKKAEKEVADRAKRVESIDLDSLLG